MPMNRKEWTKQIDKEPRNCLLRFAFADWLDDNNKPNLAQLQRLFACKTYIVLPDLTAPYRGEEWSWDLWSPTYLELDDLSEVTNCRYSHIHFERLREDPSSFCSQHPWKATMYYNSIKDLDDGRTWYLSCFNTRIRAERALAVALQILVER